MITLLIFWQMNSNDDCGVMVGNWSNCYGGAIAPTTWCGSSDILKRYHLSGGVPVKYAQSVAFAGVTNTSKCLCKIKRIHNGICDVRLFIFSLFESVEMFGYSCTSRDKLLLGSRYRRVYDHRCLFRWELRANRSSEPWFNLVWLFLSFESIHKSIRLSRSRKVMLLSYSFIGTSTHGMRPGWPVQTCRVVLEVGRWWIPHLKRLVRASIAAVPPLSLQSAVGRSSSNMTRPSSLLKYVNAWNLMFNMCFSSFYVLFHYIELVLNIHNFLF